MTTTGLHHFNIRAPENRLAEVRDFYCTTIGLSEGTRPPFNFAGYWLYAGGQAVLHLSAAKDGQVYEGRDVSIDHVAFACSGHEDYCKKLDGLGIVYRTMVVPGIGHKQIFFRDPLGNGIELNFGEDSARPPL